MSLWDYVAIAIAVAIIVGVALWSMHQIAKDAVGIKEKPDVE